MVGALLGVKEGGKWKGCRVRLGTTDSIAGFVGATQGITNCKGGVGTAVTSLGTTLAIKMVSERKIFDDERGVYSHVLPRYLMEGGGAVEGGGRNFDDNDSKNGADEDVVYLVGGASQAGCKVLRDLGYDDEELKELEGLIAAAKGKVNVRLDEE